MLWCAIVSQHKNNALGRLVSSTTVGIQRYPANATAKTANNGRRTMTTDLQDGREPGYFELAGTCKEASEKLALSNPELTIVRGYYHCPLWGKREQANHRAAHHR